MLGEFRLSPKGCAPQQPSRGSSVIDSTVGFQLTGPVQLRGTALVRTISCEVWRTRCGGGKSSIIYLTETCSYICFSWTDGRVVYRTCLENKRAERLRGFESLSVRLMRLL